MADVHGRLPRMLTDFVDGQPLEEMKLQSSALIARQSLQGPLQVRLPVEKLHAFGPVFVAQIFNARNEFLRIRRIVKIPPDQVFAAVQSAVISHPRQPRSSRSLGGVEKRTLVEYEKKNIVNEILGFGTIP